MCRVRGVDVGAGCRHARRSDRAPPHAYEPGELYRRELPCLLRVLEEVTVPLDVVVVDAFVTLDPAGRPGLGARLYESLRRTVAVVGVAKTRYAAATTAIPILRGTSQSPPWITAAGMDASVTADHVRSMHGPHRIPTLLRRVDQLGRQS
jgi:deoxyribonuclease V